MESSLQASRLLSPPEMCVCACVRASEPVCDGSPAGRACPFCAPMRRVALVSFASPPPATLLGVSTHPSALFSSSLCQASSSQRFFCHVLGVLPVVSSHLLVYPAHLTRLHPTRRPSSRLFSHRRRPTLLSLLCINIDPPLSPIYKCKYRLQLSDRKSPRELLRARPPSRVHRPRLNGKPRPGLRLVRIRARCVEPCDRHTRRQIQHGCPWRGRR